MRAENFVFAYGDDALGGLHGEPAAAGGHCAGSFNVSEAAESSTDLQIRALKILRNNSIAQ